MKIGSIAALYALQSVRRLVHHINISLSVRFHFLGGTTSYLILKRVRSEVMVRVRVRLVFRLNLRFGIGLVWNSTDY